MTELKGTIQIGPNMNVRKTGKKEITFHDDRKNKQYVLVQPENGQIKIAQDKAKGYKHEVDDWLTKLNEVSSLIEKQHKA